MFYSNQCDSASSKEQTYLLIEQVFTKDLSALSWTGDRAWNKLDKKYCFHSRGGENAPFMCYGENRNALNTVVLKEPQRKYSVHPKQYKEEEVVNLDWLDKVQ